MSADSASLPISQSSGCCSETKAVPGVLPIVSEKGSTENCCSETAPTGTGSCCSAPAQPAAGQEDQELDDGALIDALREVIDPELMVNIVDLGLVYSINHTDKKVLVEMTLTIPACPAGPQIISQSKMALEKVSGVETAEIKLTMSPPWTPDRMTDEARDQLGIF